MPNIVIPSTGFVEASGTVTQAGSNQVLNTVTTVTLPTANSYVPSDIDIKIKPKITVGAGSLSNQATSGTTYTDISATGPILNSGDYLYINKGWFDDQKISLARLIPDDTTPLAATAPEILSGYKAYDKDGTLLVGTMTTVTPTVAGGDVTASVSSSVSSPGVTVNANGRLSFVNPSTNNQPGYGYYYGVRQAPSEGQFPAGFSGIDGTDYMKINGDTTGSGGSMTVTATASRSAVTWDQNLSGNISLTHGNTVAGIGTQTDTDTETLPISASVTDNFLPYYIPFANLHMAGDGQSLTSSSDNVSGSISLSNSISGTMVDSSNMSEYGIAHQSSVPSGWGNDYLYMSVTPSSSGGSVSGTVTMNVKCGKWKTDNDCIGLIHIDDNTEIIGELNSSFTHNVSTSVSVTGGSSDKYYIRKVVPAASGGGLSATTMSVTPSGGTDIDVNPNVGFYVGTTGTAVTPSTYGISNSIPASSPSTYVRIDPDATTSGDKTVSSSITVTRAAVTVSSQPGLTNGTGTGISSDSEQYSGTATVHPNVVSANPTMETKNYYVQVVDPKGTGGTVTKTSGTGNITLGGNITLSLGGTLPGNSSYGVVNSIPSGSSASDYLSFTPAGDGTNVTASGTVSIDYSRSDVTPLNNYKGLVSMSTSDVILAQGTGTLSHTLSGISVSASFDNAPVQYIKKVTPAASGGSLSQDTMTVSGSDISATAGTKFYNQTNSTMGTEITAASMYSRFGVVSDQSHIALSGDYVKIDPYILNASSLSTTVTGSVRVTRAAVSVGSDPGATTGTGTGLSSTYIDASGTGTVGVTEGQSVNFYAPVVAPSATVSGTATANPTVNPSLTTVDDGGTPVSFSSSSTGMSNYIAITAGGSAGSSGSVTLSGSWSCSKGITEGGSSVAATGNNTTVSVSASVGSNVVRYLEIYDGSYTITTI